jgi:deoxyguanosine kinase
LFPDSPTPNLLEGIIVHFLAGINMRIELCGPLGIGKTTLAQNLSTLTGWKLVREPVETHPFLRAFYNAPAEHAFEKNLFFLLDYLHEIKSRASGNFIFDHSAVVHRSYAALNHIQPHEKPVFFALDKAIEALGPPDLLINLVCPSDIILSRIARRGRDFEAAVDISYVAALNDEVQRQVQLVSHYIPVVHVDAALYDFENRPQDVERVLSIICDHVAARGPAPARKTA